MSRPLGVLRIVALGVVLASAWPSAGAQASDELRLRSFDPAEAYADAARDPADQVPFWIACAGGLTGILLAGAAAAVWRRKAIRLGEALARAERCAGRLAETTGDITRQRAEAEQLQTALAAARGAEKAAADANRVKGEFLASMSHEIRTPLNAILGFADLLLDEPDLGVAAKRNADRIKAGGDALLTIVNDILDHAQLESGALKLDLRPFAMPLLIDECIALVERLAVAKNLSLRVELLDRFPAAVMGDESRLRQILLNLVNNALKFTDAGSVVVRIRFDRAAGPDRVVFEVEDTGIGIADKDLPNLFQRFRQIDGTMRRTHGGTGLGLAISKSLVERMGGEIGVSSAKGSGSTFWFSLDLPPASLVLETERTAALPAPPRRLSILLVEDVPINQELARAILEARGHDVDAVDDGAQAITAVEHGVYDLVLMDVQMPHVDGLMATRAIRRLPLPGRFVPIVAMTANVLRDQVEAARAAGMDDVLAKPLNLDAIEALLDRAKRNEIGRGLDSETIDRGVFARLAHDGGDDRADAMLADFVSAVTGRFTQPLSPFSFDVLKSEAQASAESARTLGFRRFAEVCRRFADAPALQAADYAELLRDLSQVVRVAERLRRAHPCDEPSRAAA